MGDNVNLFMLCQGTGVDPSDLVGTLGSFGSSNYGAGDMSSPQPFQWLSLGSSDFDTSKSDASTAVMSGADTNPFPDEGQSTQVDGQGRSTYNPDGVSLWEQAKDYGSSALKYIDGSKTAQGLVMAGLAGLGQASKDKNAREIAQMAIDYKNKQQSDLNNSVHAYTGIIGNVMKKA